MSTVQILVCRLTFIQNFSTIRCSILIRFSPFVLESKNWEVALRNEVRSGQPVLQCVSEISKVKPVYRVRIYTVMVSFHNVYIMICISHWCWDLWWIDAKQRLIQNLDWYEIGRKNKHVTVCLKIIFRHLIKDSCINFQYIIKISSEYRYSLIFWHV